MWTVSGCSNKWSLTLKPEVIILRMEGHRLSEKYAKMTRKSWEKEGFQCRYFNGITPQTMITSPVRDWIQWGKKDWTNNHDKEKKRLAQEGKLIYYPVFTGTEQAVWHSHLALWKHIIDDVQRPVILVEHDGRVVRTPKPVEGDWSDYQFYQLASNPLGGFYVTPNFLRGFIRHFRRGREDKKIIVNSNTDGYMHYWIMAARLSKSFKKKIWTCPDGRYIVDTKWAKSTINHRRYHEEQVKDE